MSDLYDIGQPTADDTETETASLHWAVRAMHRTHPCFDFTAGLLRYSIEFGSLTPRQLDTAAAIIRRLRAEMYATFGK